jgi:hypothetical protein
MMMKIKKSRPCSVHSIRPGTLFTWRWNKGVQTSACLPGDRGLYICTKRVTNGRLDATVLDGNRSGTHFKLPDPDINFRIVLDVEPQA